MAFVAGGAQASTTLLNFSGEGYTGSLVVTTSSVTEPNPYPCGSCNSSQGYLVSSLTGTVNGDAASLLPFNTYAHNDNLLYSTAPYLDWGDLGFAAGGIWFNLFGGEFVGHPGYYLCATSIGCSADVYDHPIALTVGVPEPGAWTLMLIGLGAVGAAMRRSRRRIDPALATA